MRVKLRRFGRSQSEFPDVAVIERPPARVSFAKTKVENLSLASISDENICRFDVAVNDALFVGGLQTVGNLNAKVQQVIGHKRSSGGKRGNPVQKRLPFQQRHHQEGLAFVLTPNS